MPAPAVRRRRESVAVSTPQQPQSPSSSTTATVPKKKPKMSKKECNDALAESVLNRQNERVCIILYEYRNLNINNSGAVNGSECVD